MVFSLICAPGGGAPLAGFHGFVSFNYCQSGFALPPPPQLPHAAFVLVGVGAPGAPPGCCLALTMAWLDNWKNRHLGYHGWVNGGVGQGVILANTVAIFAGMGGAAAWPATTDVLMAPLPFAAVPPGGLGPVAPLAGGVALLTGAIVAARYIILVAIGPLGSHATGVMRAGNAVFFFDPNHGEIHFSSVLDFVNWFTFSGFRQSCLDPILGGMGGGTTMRLLRYN